ncbi:MAG: universal stress protein [Bacteroidales bacterium]|nr:universal stress protein [Candidatus Colimorpha onthohippi]
MKSIVVGTDFSKGSMVALEMATVIANQLKTNISIMWVQQPRGILDSRPDETLMDKARVKLQEICDQYQPLLNVGRIRWDVAHGKVAQTLANKARHENAPLIVIGTNGASGFEKYWMGSTAVRIVQESPCPTLTVREGFDFHKKLERVVVPLRCNDNSRQKIAPAASMAKIFGAEAHILGLIDNPNDAAVLRTYIKQACQYMINHEVKYTSTVKKYSNYCDTVMRYVESVDADMVVINTEQDRIISQLFLGTNAQQIVHNSQIPVLCIHPEDYIDVAGKI